MPLRLVASHAFGLAHTGAAALMHIFRSALGTAAGAFVPLAHAAALFAFHVIHERDYKNRMTTF